MNKLKKIHNTIKINIIHINTNTNTFQHTIYNIYN